MQQMFCAINTIVLVLAFVCASGTTGLARELKTDDTSKDETAARAIVEKAIQVIGGEEKLAPFKSQSWKERGVYYGLSSDGFPYMSKLAVEWPDKFRLEIPQFMTIVLNGEHGWSKERGTTNETKGDQLAEQLEEQRCGYVSSLVPLKGKEYSLSLIEEITIDGRPAAGVKVTQSGHRDVKLYFDKSTGLLVRSAWRVRSQEQGGKEMSQETSYTNYKDVLGAKIPMKIEIKRDGNRFLEAETLDLKAGQKLDPKLFEKP